MWLLYNLEILASHFIFSFHYFLKTVVSKWHLRISIFCSCRYWHPFFSIFLLCEQWKKTYVKLNYSRTTVYYVHCVLPSLRLSLLLPVPSYLPLRRGKTRMTTTMKMTKRLTKRRTKVTSSVRQFKAVGKQRRSAGIREVRENVWGGERKWGRVARSRSRID